MSCDMKSGLDSILYCMHGGSMQHAVMMLNLKSQGERRGVGLDGEPCCEAELTTRLGHTTLGLRAQTVAPQAASCPWQIPLLLGLLSAQDSKLLSWEPEFQAP